MTAFDAVTPTLGSVAQSYEYIVDVAPVPVGAAPKNYRNVPDINQFNPQFAAQLQDITTYANKGQQAQTKVGSAPTAAFNILKIRDALGDFQPEWQILKTASDKSGKDNLVYLRWYDALGAADAYEGLFLVSRDNRPENGPQGPGWDAFTFTAAGPIVPIVNPVKSGSKTGWTVQVTGTPTGGTYQLTLNGTPTSNLAYNALAADIATALNGLAGVTGISGITASGTGTITVTLPTAAILAKGTTALTGGTSPNVTVA